MKRVSARDFQLNAAKYLKQLPIILTNHNIPVATVIPFVDVSDGSYTPMPVPPSKKTGTLLPFSESSRSFNEEEKKLQNKWPTQIMGKPLSGRNESCPVCSEVVPVEFAQKHYNDKHGDI